MARLLRIEFPGACYHVTSRGNRQTPVSQDDGDRLLFLGVLEGVATPSRIAAQAERNLRSKT